MDIVCVANEFIELNQRRKGLEKQEERLKALLVEYFRSTVSNYVETEKGKVSYIESQKVEYDVPALRQALPEPVFNLVTKVSVNDAVLSQLIKDGKVSQGLLEHARKVTPVYRVVAQATPGAASARAVGTAASQAAIPPRVGAGPTAAAFPKAPSPKTEAPEPSPPGASSPRAPSPDGPPRKGSPTKRTPPKAPSPKTPQKAGPTKAAPQRTKTQKGPRSR